MSSQLKLTDITKKFEANTVNEKVALDHLNLTVEPGQFVTVLGSNGSGKSTMFNVILGSLFPDEGKVYLGDKDITKLKDYKRALNIGCLYQNPLRGTAPNLTIEENLALAYTRKASPSFSSRRMQAAISVNALPMPNSVDFLPSMIVIPICLVASKTFSLEIS